METVFHALEATFFDLEIEKLEGSVSEGSLRGEGWARILGGKSHPWTYTARLLGSDMSVLLQVEIQDAANRHNDRRAYRDFWKLFNRNLKLLSA